MAPIRTILASRAVVAGLTALGCLAFFMAFSGPEVNFNTDRLSRPNHSNDRQQNHYGPAVVNDNYASTSESSLGRYPGRKQPTITAILDRAEVYYQRILAQRKEWLNMGGFGTSRFDPWDISMYYWWYFPTSFVCPHDIQRVGPLSDGGKWICGLSLYEEKPRAKCVIYSFGINYETRFESEMMDRTDCEIWAYDASVPNMGPALVNRKGANFKPYFVGKTDHVDAQGVQYRTLPSLMKENGHDWIDILKVDIEGAEYGTFDAIMDAYPNGVLPFSQLQLELHVHENHIGFSDFLSWWERLESNGIRPWWTEINLNPALNNMKPWASEYCFINTRGGAKNLLIQDF